MKILHIISGLNVGGAELMLKRLIEHQNKATAYEHSVISLTDKGEVGPKLEALGIEVRALEMKGLLGLPLALSHLCKAINQMSPDIVQTWMYHADLLGGVAARISGVRNVIWGIRTTDLERGGKGITRLIRRICAALSSFIPAYIVCAAEASKKAHAAIGYKETKMLVIPNGFDLPRLSATEEQRVMIRNSCGFTDDNVVIISLGRYNVVKDQANFISATGLLAQRFPHLRFLMVGRGNDWDNKCLVERIAQTGFIDRYVLMGERQDIAACLKAADIFCLHSRTEGFPNVLGEAMALGLPCVSTDVGDAHLLLGGLGVLVPPQDPDNLASGLQKIIDLAPAERHLQGKEARERIEGEFSMEKSSARFEALYNTLSQKTK